MENNFPKASGYVKFTDSFSTAWIIIPVRVCAETMYYSVVSILNWLYAKKIHPKLY